jgi:hypothetical protein
VKRKLINLWMVAVALLVGWFGHRFISAVPPGRPADSREPYLALAYKEFDATYGSGWRRFHDQPRNPSETATLVEAYLERHEDLTTDQQRILHFHAAQLFALGGMDVRALPHLEAARAPNPDSNHIIDATKAFLLRDRDGLLAARRRMAAGSGAAEPCDWLLEHFGDSYAENLWIPLSAMVSVPTNASPEHRAAAEDLAHAIGRPLTIAPNEGVPGDCIWLDVRTFGSTPDVNGYIILHGNKSTVITATSQRWLATAAERFIASCRERNLQREAPFGLVTSFQLAR